jgi:hypothetical protein
MKTRDGRIGVLMERAIVLSRAICENARELGQTLAVLKQQWKSGTIRGFRSFECFCIEALAVCRKKVDRLIRVSKSFTREEVATFGVSKLEVVLIAAGRSPKERSRIWEALRAGASAAELKRMIWKNYGKRGPRGGGPIVMFELKTPFERALRDIRACNAADRRRLLALLTDEQLLRVA